MNHEGKEGIVKHGQGYSVQQLARNKIYAGIPDEDVHLALAICQKYGLDPLLKHVVLIRNRTGRYDVYITRNGLLHIAHRSGKQFHIVWHTPEKLHNPYRDKDDISLRGTLYIDGKPSWEASLWFSEYVQTNAQGNRVGFWDTHPAAAHQKVVETYLLRRGFDISLPVLEEVEAIVNSDDVVVIDAEAEPPEKPQRPPAATSRQARPVPAASSAPDRPYSGEVVFEKLLELSEEFEQAGYDSPAGKIVCQQVAALLDKALGGTERRRMVTEALFGFDSVGHEEGGSWNSNILLCQAKAVFRWLGVPDGGFEPKGEYWQQEGQALYEYISSHDLQELDVEVEVESVGGDVHSVQ